MITTFGRSELEQFRGLISRRLGLQFEDGKLGFLADVLQRRLETLRQGCDRYLARLEGEASPEEIGQLAQEVTVAETYFFRNVEQYRAFAEIALPDRIRSAQAEGRRLQIVSAGCASGEEPYSLAIVVRDAPGIRSADVAILGLDINPAMLERSRRGRFSAWVLRETPSDVQRRWFRQEGREFALDDAVRASVTFDVGNLADGSSAFWQPDSFDVVFCRNVLMYFTPDTAQALIARITRALRPGGYLFLGHAETLRGLSSDFHLRHTHETFYYQRKGRAEVTLCEVTAFSAVATPTPPPAALVDLVDGTDSWVEAIQRASQRIEALTSRKPPEPLRAGSTSVAAKPAWDMGVALDLLRRERFAEALGLVDAFPPESGRDTDVLLLRGVLLTHSSQFANAEETCRRLLDIDELNAGAHYLLALCREGAGDHQGSTYHDQVAMYLDPAFAMPHLHLGLLARRTGDGAAARRELAQALVLLQREDTSRLLLFGGGFGRDALEALCRTELLTCGGKP